MTKHLLSCTCALCLSLAAREAELATDPYKINSDIAEEYVAPTPRQELMCMD